MRHEPRWPDGPEIAIGVTDVGLGLTHDCTPDGSLITEVFAGMDGRLDGRALATRIKELQPRLAILVTGTRAPLEYEAGVIIGLGIGLLAALGVEVEFEPLATVPEDRVLH